MNRLGQNKRKLLGLLITKHLNENEEEEEMLFQNYTNFRKPVSKLFLKRQHEGAFNILVINHLVDEEEKFKRYFRFSREQFSSLLNYIYEDLKTYPCNRVKSPITPAEKLAFALRFLATGESYRSLAFSYRISPSALCKIIPQVLKAIKEKLVKKLLPPPDQVNWNKKSEQFWTRWNFPNCVAAVDGKHVRIVAPANSGSLFFNYKGYFSVVLLAMVDANYKFLVVDVGSYGKEGDAGIFNKSGMRMLIDKKSIFPLPEKLPNSDILLPHVIVGDEAFSLSEHVMKPYCKKQAVADSKKRTFNYHLSRARRVSENAFGILCATFRIFFTPINVKPETAELIIIVCCCLHNMLRKEYTSTHNCSVDLNLEFPTENMIPLAGTGGFATSEGFKVRSRFTDYFNSRRNVENEPFR